jgi:hypothetical protein
MPFDASNLYILHALQDGPVVSGYDGVVPLTGFVPMVVDGENLTPTHQVIETAEILPSGTRAADLRGKKGTSGKSLNIPWTPDNHAHILADCHGDIASALIGASLTAYRHTLGAGDPRRRTYRVWRDDGRPTTLVDVMVTQYTMSVTGGAALAGTVQVSYGEYYRFDHAVIEAAGAGIAPRIRGLAGSALLADGGPVYVKAISIDPGVSVTVEVALSAQVYAGTATLEIPIAAWTALRNHQAAGSPRLGAVESEVELYVEDDTDYLANDEWSFDLFAPLPVTSVPTYTRIPGPRCFITAAGVRRQVDSIECTYERPVRQPENPGGVFSRQLIATGTPTGSVSIQRELVDAEFIDYLESGGSFDVEILGYAAAAAIDPAVDDRETIPSITWTATGCTMSGDEPGIQSAEQRQETIAARAESVEVEVVNASATI